MGPTQPMNIFLSQEIDRIQKVIELVKNSLEDLLLAIDGIIIMSEVNIYIDNIIETRPDNFTPINCQWTNSNIEII